MTNKAAVVILGLGAGTLALIALARKAKAAPPPEVPPELPPETIPTVDRIMTAKSIGELYAWYNLIGELYIIGKISYKDYMEFYSAYEKRWYQLAGVS